MVVLKIMKSPTAQIQVKDLDHYGIFEMGFSMFYVCLYVGLTQEPSSEKDFLVAELNSDREDHFSVDRQ